MKSSYQKYADKIAAKTRSLSNVIRAFVSGGIVCVIGQGLIYFYTYLGISKDNARLYETVTLVFVTAILTGFSLFDKIGKHAGAGVLVPITGFANSVVSTAIDNKSEGWVLGVGSKMFIIAGPVILYGTLASFLYGTIYYIYGLIV